MVFLESFTGGCCGALLVSLELFGVSWVGAGRLFRFEEDIVNIGWSLSTKEWHVESGNSQMAVTLLQRECLLLLQNRLSEVWQF